MANFDFYGLKTDLLKVLSFIYDETDIVIFESYSEYDSELRRFASLAEMQNALEIGGSPKGIKQLELWSPSVIEEPKLRRIDLKVKDHSFRYTIEAVGLIQLHLGGLRNNAIIESHYGHWSKAGAEQRSALPTHGCNWDSLQKLSGRLQRFIRGLAVAKFDGRVILPEALTEIQNGKRLRFLNTEFDAASVNIIPLK
ncbi:MAG: hypothetical protein HZA89_16790 [Verrucomicrobia bacterium]|nr:hypothetical protein [Verrucomicrobiota bacterium]